MDPVIQWVICLGLTCLWLRTASHKLGSFRHFAATVSGYRLLPEFLTGIGATFIVAAEATAGVGVLLPAVRTLALAGSAALLASYAVAIAINLLRGRRDIDCGCTGPAFRQPLSGWLVARNLALTGIALLGLLPVQPRSLEWVDLVSLAGTVTAMLLLYIAINRLIGYMPMFSKLRSST